METLRAPRTILTVLILALLASVPVAASAIGQPFYMTLFMRVMIYALAAISLNLILGYGGLVSFGHALYLGIGAYSVAILASQGITSGPVQLAAALLTSLVIAAITGAISLRVSGIAFIMITLAFAQMFFFMAVSLKQFGGDEGMTIPALSDFGPLDLSQKPVFYYTVLVLVAASLYMSKRIVESRFGLVLRGSKSNDRRMKALGFPTFRYKLAAYVISAMMCSVAGLLLANLTGFSSPDYMAWNRSGELIVMAVLGGMGTVIGPVAGATALMLVEEILSSYTEHWMLILGPLIVIAAILARSGIAGIFRAAGEEGQ